MSMSSNSMRIINEAFFYPRTSIDFIHFHLISTSEGRRHEQIAREENSQGNYHPLQAHEHNRINLKFVSVANLMQILSCLHFIFAYIISIQYLIKSTFQHKK